MTEKKVITAQAQGHNGPIDLEIGAENQEIVNVDVKKHSETKGIFNQVFSKLRNDILDNHSFDIDAISDDTFLSDVDMRCACDFVVQRRVLPLALQRIRRAHRRGAGPGTRLYTV